MIPVTVDPERMSGKPCVAGTRVTVSALLHDFADGDTISEIAEARELSIELVEAVMRFVADLADAPIGRCGQ